MQTRSAIESVEPDDQALVVRWSDGRVSRFHYIWLRDNCTCNQCGTTETGARFLQLIDIPEDVSPERAELDEGSLAIRWRPDGHRSSYEPRWLREHCYSTEALSNERRVWGAEITEDLTHRSYTQIRDSEEERLELVEQIYRDGLVLLSGVEAARDATERMAELIGPVRAYSYEPAVSDLMLGQGLANSAAPLAPHLDEPFRSHQPGLVVLHCIAADAAGGGASLLVDGFKVAAVLREREPQAFDLLCRTPAGFRRRLEGGFDHYAEAPVISLDSSGEVSRFCFAERSAAPVRAPEHLIGPIYAARRALLTVMHDESLQAKIALRPGDAFIADNYRVMHGRTAYQGGRHLRHCHIDRDEAFSRYRMACRRLDRTPVHS